MTKLISPFQWQVTAEVNDTIDINGITFYRAGIAAENEEKQEIIGAAADLQKPPIQRAQFELQERIVIFDHFNHSKNQVFPLRDIAGNTIGQTKYEDIFARSSNPQEYEYAKANGVALHQTWNEACISASLEAIERQHILSSWFGLRKPIIQSRTLPTTLTPLSSNYTCISCLLGKSAVATLKQNISTACIVLLPKNNQHRLIMSFGAGTSEESAQTKAEKELLQAIAFSWETPPPKQAPEPSATPEYHREYYAYPKHHHIITEWLQGDFYHRKSSDNTTFDMQFVDLTPMDEHSFYVAKAICQGLWPLIFGDFDYQNFVKAKTHLYIHALA